MIKEMVWAGNILWSTCCMITALGEMEKFQVWMCRIMGGDHEECIVELSCT
jgi:hypothetical protein